MGERARFNQTASRPDFNSDILKFLDLKSGDFKFSAPSLER
jgi:hypothetical protein